MRGWFVVLVLAACGDNADICDYHEHDDSSPLEMTGLTVGDHAINVCGSIDGGHYDAALGIVDSDRFHVTVGGDGELLVEVTGDPELAVFDAVNVRLFDSAQTLVGQGQLAASVASHGAFLAQVPPGDLDVVVEARSQASLVGSLAYRVRLLPDPGQLCPTITAHAQYVESYDGPDQTANDVALVDFTQPMPIMADPGGSKPEPTHLSIEGGLPEVIAGTAGSVGRGDQYLDRDTYALATDDYTNELLFRLDWPDTTLDLDLLVLDPSTLAPLMAATRASTTQREFGVVAVKPRTTYLVWIGRFQTPPGPASEPYGVTVCGNYFN